MFDITVTTSCSLRNQVLPRQARWADFLFVRHEVTKELTVNTVNTWVTGDRNRIYSASAEHASKNVGCFAGGHHMMPHSFTGCPEPCRCFFLSDVHSNTPLARSHATAVMFRLYAHQPCSHHKHRLKYILAH